MSKPTSGVIDILPIRDALTGLLNYLGSKALEQVALTLGATHEVEKLRATLSTINALLRDAEKQQSFNHQDSDWLGKLKNAVFDAKEMLDEFSTNAALQQEDDAGGGIISYKVRRLISSSRSVVRDNRMGHRIKEIRERLDNIAADRQKFHWVEPPTFTSPVARSTRSQTHSFVFEEDVIGRDDDKLSMVGQLLDPNLGADNVVVLPIVGTEGLGKTTLAQPVYNDPKVVDHFELKIWICVSDVFNVKEIVQKIVKSGRTGGDPGNLELDDLQRMLRQKIYSKRYLLVLDDVWNEDPKKWLELKQLLVRGGAKGSRIIVTTRSENAAMMMTNNRSEYLHKLQGLSESASWSLFIGLVCNGQEPTDQSNVIEAGKEIVRRCGGIPSAIQNVASVMLYKDPTEWPSFLEN